MAAKTAPLGLPKSGAISKGYNFASTWEQVTSSFPSRSSPIPASYAHPRSDLIWSDLFLPYILPFCFHFCFTFRHYSLIHPIAVQNAPLTDQQQAAIATLCHAVAERPFPVDLVRFLISSSIFFNSFSNSSSGNQLLLTPTSYLRLFVSSEETLPMCFLLNHYNFLLNITLGTRSCWWSTKCLVYFCSRYN